MTMTNGFHHADCLEKYDALFDDVQIKAQCFDRLASLFYDRNFSTTNKVDIELLMFHFLMHQMIEKHQQDGVLDYKECSEYTLSKILGITETKVRNLKIKKELVYPEPYSWVKSFANMLMDHKLTKVENSRVLISIPDPNVYLEIKNFIETKGGFVEYHLNPKLLDIRLEYLYDFAVLLEDEETRSDVESSALSRINGIRKENMIVNAVSVGAAVLSCSADLADTWEMLKDVFSADNKIMKFLKSISKNIS